MNLVYKILWFEDEILWAKPLIPEIKSFVEELGFQFVEPKFEKDNSNIDNIEYDNYDLILMDYRLSGSEKGDALINRIREHSFYSEILFYSASGAPTLRKAVLDNELDGVYCSDRQRDSFLPKVKEVIKATVKKVLDVNTLRGIVMAETSDIDEKMLEIISLYANMLDTDGKNAFLEKRRKKIVDSTESKIKKIKISNIDEISGNFLFDANQKWMTVLDIVKKIISEREEITKLYDPEIIKKRNLLAHVKETKNESGKIQLAYKDFIFNDKESKEILISLKKHEENFNTILEFLKKT
jgi:DNA-binding NarL/FixJ family response regulator